MEIFDNSALSTGTAIWLNTHYNNIKYIRDNEKSKGDSASKRVNQEAWKGLAEKYNIKELQQQIKSLKLQKTATGATTPNIVQPPPPPLDDDPGTQYVTTTVNSSTVLSNVSVGPLCTTEWSQKDPYNLYCPSITFNGTEYRAPTGCVPTAMAQIMYFWKYPSNYNWSAMQTNWQYYTTGQNTDCARLMYDIGSTTYGIFNTSFASYGFDATGADDANCPYVFGEFGYHALRTTSLVGQQINGSYNGTDYAGFLYNEITQNNRPCMVGGYDDTNTILFVTWPTGNAHEWVCDGTQRIVTHQNITVDVYTVYQSGNTSNYSYNTTRTLDQKFLHMNWGWGPQISSPFISNNGWYDCSINYTQAGDIYNNYQYFQTIIYDIHPNA